ncbi:MAG: methylmalonyl-CoA mutase family protein, partial [Robiginitalea sp.]|nr:methylmalonyl-CoA mutase family protein [Robiginitalea sp.]
MKTPKPFWDFEPVSARAWKQKIQADLKGGDYNELLTWRSPEGITVKPFYSEEDLPAGSGENASRQPLNWQIGHAAHPESEEGISLAREALEQGADGLLTTVNPENSGKLTGVKALPGAKWFDLRGIAPETLETLKEMADASHEWLLDPIGDLVATGNWREGMASDLNGLGTVINTSAGKTGLAIHLSQYQNAGATRVQELAYGLAHAHEYLLRAAETPDIQPLLDQPVFLVAVGN